MKCARGSAEFVRDEKYCITSNGGEEEEEGSSADQFGAFFGRKGVQRCLTHLSGFPFYEEFGNPPCSTRGPKKKQWQRRRRKVRGTPSHDGNVHN